MTKKEINNLSHGLYIVFWAHHRGGGFSLASVGGDQAGKAWFAPTNWTSGSTMMEEHSSAILKVELICKKKY